MLSELVDVRHNDKLVGVKTPRIFFVVDLAEKGDWCGEVCWVMMQPVYVYSMRCKVSVEVGKVVNEL